MRRLAICFILLGPICSAHAADMADDFGVLRGTSTFDPSDHLSGPSYVPGTPAYTDWSGVYAGVSAGYTSTNFNFQGAPSQLVSNALQQTVIDDLLDVHDWDVLGKTSKSGTSYGVFAGYNWQWEDAVIGVEASYNQSESSGISPSIPIARHQTQGNTDFGASLTANAAMKIKESGGIRMRAGWTFGNIMPYLSAGLAVGRADASRSVNIVETESDATTHVPTGGVTYNQSEARSDAFIYGYSVGAGVDMMLLPNLFVRGEVEYMNFAQLLGIKADTVSARVGVGLKY